MGGRVVQQQCKDLLEDFIQAVQDQLRFLHIMGELRKVSRKLELKLGAPKVYGTLKGGKASAPRKKELMRSRAALSTTTPEWREPRVHATATRFCLWSSQSELTARG